MNSTTAAELLVETLKVNGVRHVFGIIGDALFPVFDALGKQSEIQYFAAAHESGAAFMASAYAKMSGRLGVCMATSGPGAANLLNGLGDAYFDHAPVLAITGQVATGQAGTGVKQDINQQQLFQTVAASSTLVSSPESLVPIVSRAISLAKTERTVTQVSIPVDLLKMTINSPPICPVALGSRGWSAGFASLLEDALTKIASSQRPLLLVGTGNHQLGEKMVALAEKMGAGIILAQQAKGVIPDMSPSVIGGIGEAYNSQCTDEADCILLFGSAPFEKKFLPSGAVIIQIAEHLAELDYSRPGPRIAGDVRGAVALFMDRLADKRNPNWQEKVRRANEERRALIHAQSQNREAPIQPAHLMAVLSRLVPQDAVIVCDIGSFVHWFDSYFAAESQTVLVSAMWRSMGSGLPGALGAAIAGLQKKVIVLTGDGGLLISAGELATAAKYNLPVTVIVANNGEYNLERTMMEADGLVPFGYDIGAPDFVKLAQAFGVKATAVCEPAGLPEALQQLLTCDGPSLLDVRLSKTGLPKLK